MRGMLIRGSSGRVRGATVLALTAVIAVAIPACSKSSSSPPLRNYDVFAQKFRFNDMPESISSGEFSISFSNQESFDITHELILLNLPSGQTGDDVIADAKDKGPDAEGDYLSFGEIGEVDTSSTHAGLFNLPPGSYVFACFETGTTSGGENGPAHAAKGMVFQFEVT